MIKNIVTALIRKSKNADFTFDEGITSTVILSFTWSKFLSWVRSFKLLLYGKAPKFLFLGRNVKFFNTRNIKFGKNIFIGEYSLIDSLGKEPIVIGDNVRIGAFARIITSMTFGNLGKGIILGDNVSMGEFACLGGAGGLEIGSGTIIGSYLSTHPENHVYSDINTPIRLQGVTRKGIKVGNDCWLGAKVTLLDGVTVGDDCIIAAGAVVTKSFGDKVIIGGVPAKIIKNRI